MYETLLALHLLFAAITFITLVMFSAWAFGAPVLRGQFTIADRAWDLSGAGVLIFGVWLALYMDGYELWDGWILAALVLFAAATFFSYFSRHHILDVLDGKADPVDRSATIWHWLRTLAVLGILVTMVWKPGA